MSQQIPSVLGMAMSAGEWSAWSAIGTIVAAAVSGVAAFIALRVPMRIAREDRRAAAVIAERQRDEQLERERQVREDAIATASRRLHEVASAVYNALDCLVGALDDYNYGRMTPPTDLRPAAGRASGQAEALRILANIPGLSDGPIIAATSAAQSMDRICEAARHVTNQGHRTPTDVMTEALEAGKAARIRIAAVVAHHSIPVRGGAEAPTLPGQVQYSPPHAPRSS